MKTALFALFGLVMGTIAYHDPDLNYHLNQIQNAQPCAENGYTYNTPTVQLTTQGVKVAPLTQTVTSPAYQYSSAGYSASTGYTNAASYLSAAYQSVPQLTYTRQPATTYQTSSLTSNYVASPGYNTQKEVHGYVTSAGLSSAAASGRTVIPQATYAQAPIIAKVTAAPLIARFSLAPAKTSYVTQNSILSGSSAKASLSSYSIQAGGPVVSQVYAAPAAQCATSAALRVPQVTEVEPTRYTAVSPPVITQYQPVGISALTPAYRTPGHSSSVSHVSPAQYSVPVLSQYASPPVPQYATPAVSHQYATPAVVSKYTVPTVSQYASAKPVQSQVAYSSAVPVVQYSAQVPVAPVAQLAYSPAQVNHVSVVGAAAQIHARKNVHTEFMENYDPHPRYAYEYGVNDPTTGDIKQQKEERDGEVVKGQYSLVEPDGSVRTVNYVADWDTGFHADVRNSKENH